MLERFDWGDWVKKHKPSVSCAEWVAKFEEDYWSRNKRTATKENSYRKYYGRFFPRLPQNKDLSIEVMLATAKLYPAQSHGRFQCCGALSVLAKFAKIDPEPVRRLSHGYKKQPQEAPPVDAEIERLILGCPDRQAQWIAGIAATFGLRNHEILSAHLERISEGLLIVDNDTKTGSRLVVAHPFNWVELFNLTERPKITLSTEGVNNRIGARVGACLKRNSLPRCYALRKAYGLRLRLSKQTPDIRARFMGHSVQIHEKHYMDVTAESHLLEIYGLFKGES